MATTNPPAAGPPPVSTYRDRYQQQMSDAFQSNSYFGLVDGIKAAEAGRAPNPGISRIVGNVTPGWEKIAAFLLMQPSKDVVQAILV